ncbi:hypothetical protein [Mesorhizobium sp. ES1-1]|uniref:hypothetical protein n=1 Tax=Mesorhizobium sp. ES1-1 TaxID=2876629 RepID=UPI001CCC0906|nr:hypothetical protein [Mesorhizobium sp. ES1-1]MBZ9678242.1 hypothetical protein [Mesorhizobium sp. ES1-1]
MSFASRIKERRKARQGGTSKAADEPIPTRRQVDAPPIEPSMQQLAGGPIEYRHYHDAPAAKPLGKGKRVHTDRYQVPRAILSWSNAKCALVGYLTGRGYTSREIERILNDGTSKDTVRGQWRRWGLPLPEQNGQRVAVMPVALASGPRNKLSQRAKKVGIAPDEFLRRIIVCVLDDDLYQAVVDDRFDPKPKKAPAG